MPSGERAKFQAELRIPEYCVLFGLTTYTYAMPIEQETIVHDIQIF